VPSPGLYFFDQSAVEIAASIAPSARRRIRDYPVLKDLSSLRVELLGRGFAWLDTGVHENLVRRRNLCGLCKSARACSFPARKR
jgi:glucose-1-phosphate thymidylyltransferase